MNVIDYGATGQYSCIYYNLYAAATTTNQGRSLNSAAALFLESFLNNNVPCASLEELIEFIHNVITDPKETNSAEIITNHADVAETFYKLMYSTGFGWIPSEKDMEIVWEIVTKLSQDELDRLYYKNNLFRFVENGPVKQGLIFILQSLESPFMDPNDPPEKIKVALDSFVDILKEYVYYPHQISNRIEKMNALIRSVSIIQDTDESLSQTSLYVEICIENSFNCWEISMR